MLTIEKLSAGYGDVQVLWDVSMEVKDGEIVALIGSNGAGKSTILAVISGLLKPMHGNITLDGQPIAGMPADRIASAGISHVPQGRRLFAGLTVRENLLMGAYSRRDSKEQVEHDLERVLQLFPVLGERLNQTAGTLSGGEQQMCAVGRGLMAHPKLLMIDELSLGLAPLVVETLMDTISQLNRQGMTILLVEQDVHVALEVAHTGYVLDVGHIIMHGPAKELMADPRIKEAYLGL
jgi:branched-chain amino acid transport system ATP-binding protein